MFFGGSHSCVSSLNVQPFSDRPCFRFHFCRSVLLCGFAFGNNGGEALSNLISCFALDLVNQSSEFIGLSCFLLPVKIEIIVLNNHLIILYAVRITKAIISTVTSSNICSLLIISISFSCFSLFCCDRKVNSLVAQICSLHLRCNIYIVLLFETASYHFCLFRISNKLFVLFLDMLLFPFGFCRYLRAADATLFGKPALNYPSPFHCLLKS